MKSYKKCQTYYCCVTAMMRKLRDRKNLNTKEQNIIVHYNVNEGLYMQWRYCMEEDAQIGKHANSRMDI